METMVKELIDQHGRKIRKLRVSLTDMCNLRCHYCMPVDQKFMPKANYLSREKITEVISELCDYGLEELRLTGGEPLMRQDFDDIITSFKSLSLKKIGLTTNAITLDKHLAMLKDNRVHHLNVSLDSLDEANFRKITFGNHLKRILKNIDQAQKMGFEIKINVVAMKGVNDHEVFDFVEYARSTGLEIRFLELMRIGFACKEQEDQFISAAELTQKLKTEFELKPVWKEKDSTSFNYLLNNGAQIGFIASESQAFCGQCSRWRLSADGMLRACLMKDDGLSIKNTTSEEREIVYQSLLGMKPFHRPVEVAHSMNAIGG